MPPCSGSYSSSSSGVSPSGWGCATPCSEGCTSAARSRPISCCCSCSIPGQSSRVGSTRRDSLDTSFSKKQRFTSKPLPLCNIEHHYIAPSRSAIQYRHALHPQNNFLAWYTYCTCCSMHDHALELIQGSIAKPRLCDSSGNRGTPLGELRAPPAAAPRPRWRPAVPPGRRRCHLRCRCRWRFPPGPGQNVAVQRPLRQGAAAGDAARSPPLTLGTPDLFRASAVQQGRKHKL